MYFSICCRGCVLILKQYILYLLNYVSAELIYIKHFLITNLLISQMPRVHCMFWRRVTGNPYSGKYGCSNALEPERLALPTPLNVPQSDLNKKTGKWRRKSKVKNRMGLFRENLWIKKNIEEIPTNFACVCVCVKVKSEEEENKEKKICSRKLPEFTHWLKADPSQDLLAWPQTSPALSSVLQTGVSYGKKPSPWSQQMSVGRVQ